MFDIRFPLSFFPFSVALSDLTKIRINITIDGHRSCKYTCLCIEYINNVCPFVSSMPCFVSPFFFLFGASRPTDNEVSLAGGFLLVHSQQQNSSMNNCFLSLFNSAFFFHSFSITIFTQIHIIIFPSILAFISSVISDQCRSQCCILFDNNIYMI